MIDPDILMNCRLCPRLTAWREQVAQTKRRAYQDWDYWGKPVPAFGDRIGRVLVVGLAPGAHGSNRTGRMFTGDDSGVFLYRALFQCGLANQPFSLRAGDGLELTDLLITAVCRCAPPDNKPTRSEIETCQPYLVDDILSMPKLQGCVALGRIALDGLLAAWRSMGYQPESCGIRAQPPVSPRCWPAVVDHFLSSQPAEYTDWTADGSDVPGGMAAGSQPAGGLSQI